MILYSGKGMVIGNNWGGGVSCYPSIRIDGKSESEVLTEARKALENGSLDSGMGYESLMGAVLEITVIETRTIDEKSFINKDSYFTTIGKVSEEWYDTCLLNY